MEYDFQKYVLICFESLENKSKSSPFGGCQFTTVAQKGQIKNWLWTGPLCFLVFTPTMVLLHDWRSRVRVTVHLDNRRQSNSLQVISNGN